MVESDSKIKAAPALLFSGIALLDEGAVADSGRIALLDEGAVADSGRIALLDESGVADSGRIALALEKFDGVLALQPRNDLARSYRALCLLALGDAKAAAEVWREHGFSDNTMFRVRLAEFVEGSWLANRRFMGESDAAAPQARKWNQRRALKNFYRRNYRGILQFVAPPPVENEVEAFLAATALEMLRHYGAAQAYLESFMVKRSEWPDPLVALKARLDVRAGHIRDAAREFASVVVMGPEDFGINYYMGVVCLAYEKHEEARQYFVRAFTNFMVDTLEFQWWQLEQVLLHPEERNGEAPVGAAAEP